MFSCVFFGFFLWRVCNVVCNVVMLGSQVEGGCPKDLKEHYQHLHNTALK